MARKHVPKRRCARAMRKRVLIVAECAKRKSEQVYFPATGAVASQ